MLRMLNIANQFLFSSKLIMARTAVQNISAAFFFSIFAQIKNLGQKLEKHEIELFVFSVSSCGFVTINS
jgi:hypothetical protein